MTLEELQAMVLKQKEELEALKAEKAATDEDLEKIKNERDEARKLNAKLFRSGVSTETKIMEQSGEAEETVEQFIDSFLSPAKKALMEMYGIKE